MRVARLFWTAVGACLALGAAVPAAAGNRIKDIVAVRTVVAGRTVFLRDP